MTPTTTPRISKCVACPMWAVSMKQNGRFRFVAHTTTPEAAEAVVRLYTNAQEAHAHDPHAA